MATRGISQIRRLILVLIHHKRRKKSSPPKREIGNENLALLVVVVENNQKSGETIDRISKQIVEQMQSKQCRGLLSSLSLSRSGEKKNFPGAPLLYKHTGRTFSSAVKSTFGVALRRISLYPGVCVCVCNAAVVFPTCRQIVGPDNDSITAKFETKQKPEL